MVRKEIIAVSGLAASLGISKTVFVGPQMLIKSIEGSQEKRKFNNYISLDHNLSFLGQIAAVEFRTLLPLQIEDSLSQIRMHLMRMFVKTILTSHVGTNSRIARFFCATVTHHKTSSQSHLFLFITSHHPSEIDIRFYLLYPARYSGGTSCIPIRSETKHKKKGTNDQRTLGENVHTMHSPRSATS